MDLQKEWDNMSELLMVDTPYQSTQKTGEINSSNNVIAQIRLKLKWKLAWLRVIDVPILITAFFVEGDLQKLLFIVFVIYEIFRALAMLEYRKIKGEIAFDTSTKQVLIQHYYAISKILRIERIWGYLMIPLSAPIGFIIFKLVENNNIMQIIQSPFFIYKILLVSLIGLPTLFLVEKANKKLFSKHLKSLQLKIDEMKEVL